MEKNLNITYLNGAEGLGRKTVINSGGSSNKGGSTEGDSRYAWYLNFDSESVGVGYDYRCNGFTVRAVQDPK